MKLKIQRVLTTVCNLTCNCLGSAWSNTCTFYLNCHLSPCSLCSYYLLWGTYSISSITCSYLGVPNFTQLHVTYSSIQKFFVHLFFFLNLFLITMKCKLFLIFSLYCILYTNVCDQVIKKQSSCKN